MFQCYELLYVASKVHLYSTKVAGGKVFILSYRHASKSNLEVLNICFLKDKEIDSVQYSFQESIHRTMDNPDISNVFFQMHYH